jgi:hypothetical protein
MRQMSITDLDLLEPRLQGLERHMNLVQARLDRTLDITTAPAFRLPLFVVRVAILIVGVRKQTLRQEALQMLRSSLLLWVTFALGWVLGWWWRSRRWEAHEP